MKKKKLCIFRIFTSFLIMATLSNARDNESKKLLIIGQLCGIESKKMTDVTIHFSDYFEVKPTVDGCFELKNIIPETNYTIQVKIGRKTIHEQTQSFNKNSVYYKINVGYTCPDVFCANPNNLFDKPRSGIEPIYQFYHKKNKDHFYTGNPNPEGKWVKKGIAFYAFIEEETGTVPIYQFYHKKNKDHFYTVNPNPEGEWVKKGIAFYAFIEEELGTVPIYQFYHKKKKDHFYTEDPNPEGKWMKQGMEFYAFNEGGLRTQLAFEKKYKSLEDLKNKKHEVSLKNKLNKKQKFKFSKIKGIYDNSGFSRFFASGDKFFLWDDKNYLRGMYYSDNAGENWERVFNFFAEDSLSFNIIEIYNKNNTFYFLGDNKTWYNYDFDKNIFSIHEVDEYDIKIFNAEFNTWKENISKQHTDSRFNITYNSRNVNDPKYIFYEHGKLSFNISNPHTYNAPKMKNFVNVGTNKNKVSVSAWPNLPLFSTASVRKYSFNNKTYLLYHHGLYELKTENEVINSSNYIPEIHEVFIGSKSIIKDRLDKFYAMEKRLKQYDKGLETTKEEQEKYNKLKPKLEDDYDYLKRMKDLFDDTTKIVNGINWEKLSTEEKNELKKTYRYKTKKYKSDREYASKLIAYINKMKIWKVKTKTTIDSIKQIIEVEIENFPIIYPVSSIGISPEKISKVFPTKNGKLFVKTNKTVYRDGISVRVNLGERSHEGMYQGYEQYINKVYYCDYEDCETIFDPLLNFYRKNLSKTIDIVDDIDQILFISPSKVNPFPNNIYFLDSINIKNNMRFKLVPYADGDNLSIITSAHTDGDGYLWTIEKRYKQGSNYPGGESSATKLPLGTRRYYGKAPSFNDYSGNISLFRYNSLKQRDNELELEILQEVAKQPNWTARTTPKMPMFYSLFKTNDNKIYFQKNRLIKQVGSNRDKQFEFYLDKTELKLKNKWGNISDVWAPQSIFTNKNTIGYYSSIFDGSKNYFNIQLGMEKLPESNEDKSYLYGSLDLDIAYIENDLASENSRPVSPYYLDSLKNVISFLEKKNDNGFLAQEYYFEKSNYYQIINASMGLNNEFLIYGWHLNQVKYLESGRLYEHPLFSNFINEKISTISSFADKYFIGTHYNGLHISR